MRRQTGIFYLACAIVFISAGTRNALSAESEPAVHVGGDVPKSGDWTVGRIRADLASDLKSVQFTSRGAQHTSNCVSMIAILKACGLPAELKMDPKADPKTKNAQLRLIVVVAGRDGYTVAFSLAEMLADVGNRQVWLALDMDGQPLSERDGPIRLIVPEDSKPARWVHSVQTISVVDGSRPTTRPAD